MQEAPSGAVMAASDEMSESDYRLVDFYDINLSDSRVGLQSRKLVKHHWDTFCLAARKKSSPLRCASASSPTPPIVGGDQTSHHMSHILHRGNCDMCNKLRDDVLIRPGEGGRYCVPCVTEHDLCVIEYDPQTGEDELANKRCYVCDCAYPSSSRGLRLHLGSKAHRKRLRDLHSSRLAHSAKVDNLLPAESAAMDISANEFADAEHAVRWSLGFFEKFRAHVGERTIELLPPMFLSNELTAYEQRVLTGANGNSANAHELHNTLSVLPMPTPGPTLKVRARCWQLVATVLLW